MTRKKVSSTLFELTERASQSQHNFEELSSEVHRLKIVLQTIAEKPTRSVCVLQGIASRALQEEKNSHVIKHGINIPDGYTVELI